MIFPSFIIWYHDIFENLFFICFLTAFLFFKNRDIYICKGIKWNFVWNLTIVHILYFVTGTEIGFTDIKCSGYPLENIIMLQGSFIKAFVKSTSYK